MKLIHLIEAQRLCLAIKYQLKYSKPEHTKYWKKLMAQLIEMTNKEFLVCPRGFSPLTLSEYLSFVSLK